jgi:phage terminase large subunit-like protein
VSWDFSCPDWADRLRAGKSLVPELPLDEAEAARAVAIFDKLRLPDVPDQPPMKEAAGPWQRDIVRAIFGSLVDGVRMVPELLAMVPKKNSKTTGGAAITLTGLLMNVRPRAEFIYVGPTQEVADLAFQQTVGMIEADEYLTKRFHVAHHTKTITDRRNKARLKVKTFDMKVVTGSKPSFILLDELHLMATINGASRIIGQIRGGMLPNPEAVLVMITTQSDQPPTGAFKAELQYARGVRDGRVQDGRLLPLLYEFPEAMQRDGSWRDTSLWPMVLPNLGRSITIPRLVADFEAAKEKGEEEERRWASQHLNVEIGLALHADRWPGADYWLDAADTTLTLDALLSRCEVATIGIDGGGLDDLLGYAVIGREKDTRRWLLWSRAWAHPIVLKRRKEIAEELKGFAADGDLIICEQPTQDIGEVADLCCRVRDSGLLPEKAGIGVDKLGLPALVDELISRGFDTDANGGTITGISQGGYLNDAIIGTERKLADGTFRHAGQGVMRWAVENAKVELKGSARAITKQAAGKAKIDPFIAMLNAAKLMSLNPEALGKSVYRTRGALVL